MTARQRRDSRREALNERMDLEPRRSRDALIGHLLDKGHDLRVGGEEDKAGVCMEAAVELARAAS